MKFEYNNKIIDVKVIGGFKLNKKEYAVCSYDDKENSKIVILEIYKENDIIKTRKIPKEDINIVFNKYKEIEEKILNEVM